MAGKNTISNHYTRLAEPIPTLSEKFISADELAMIFDLPTRGDMSSYLNKFLYRNKKNFEFIGIRAESAATKSGIILYTSKYAGSIPIKSLRTSKYTVDLNVTARYDSGMGDEEIYNILSIIGQEALPEFHPKLQLVTSNAKPPLYFECQTFVDKYIEAKKKHWTKFISKIKVENVPRSSTNWSKYARNSYDPNNVLRFENKRNIQTTNHKEWCQINYVLSICIKELRSNKTPHSIRTRYSNKLRQLEAGFDPNTNIPCTKLKIGTSDFAVIKELKTYANHILTDSSTQNRSWRVDVAKVYEKYVQYVLKKSICVYGWDIRCNPKYGITGEKQDWALQYLEPDIVLIKGDEQIIVDAKYKSHMLGNSRKSKGEQHESFRHDLHQVLAYSTFNNMSSKIAILMYPIAKPNEEKLKNKEFIKVQKQQIRSPFSDVDAKIYFIGIPFTSTYINETIIELGKTFKNIIK